MMRSVPGGFLRGGKMLRSLALSPMNAMLQQAHQMARRHLEAGGTVASPPKRAKPDRAPRDFVLPLDVDAEEVRRAIEAGCPAVNFTRDGIQGGLGPAGGVVVGGDRRRLRTLESVPADLVALQRAGAR